jgi:hypothetical protein
LATFLTFGDLFQDSGVVPALHGTTRAALASRIVRALSLALLHTRSLALSLTLSSLSLFSSLCVNLSVSRSLSLFLSLSERVRHSAAETDLHLDPHALSLTLTRLSLCFSLSHSIGLPGRSLQAHNLHRNGIRHRTSVSRNRHRSSLPTQAFTQDLTGRTPDLNRPHACYEPHCLAMPASQRERVIGPERERERGR